MTSYKHTQVGYLIISVLFALTIFYIWLFGVIATEIGSRPEIIVTMVLVLFILASFSTLQVRIDENYVRIKFGYGIFQKKLLLREISSAKIVKNHWYYGWGIRLWLWPSMLIFNVSVFDAVEVIMKNGRIYRIGTDVSRELETAINLKITK